MATDGNCGFRNNGGMSRGKAASDLAEWLKGEFARTGKSQAGLARELRINPAAVNRILKGSRKVQAHEIPIIRAYFGPNGELTYEIDFDPVSGAQEYQRREHIPGSQPEISGAAGAGPGEMPGDAVVHLKRGEIVSGHAVRAEWFFPPDYLRHELGAAPSATWIFKVVGDSMTPSLQPGDRVLIDTSHSTPVPDGIYLIDEGHGPIVKRVNLVRRADPAELEIISDNEINARYRMPADEVRIIGRVCGRVTRM